VRPRLAFPFLALLAAAAPAAADEFALKDGSTVEAQVLRDLGDRLEVRVLEGRRTIQKDQIRPDGRKRSDTPWEVFEKEFLLADAVDAEAVYRLGIWAREKGLKEEAVRAFRRAIAADPDHSRARTALGHTRIDGKWVVPAGEVPVPESRGTPVENEAPGPLESALGETLARRESDNFRMESSHLPQRTLGRYLDTLERVREAALAYLDEPPPVGARRSLFILVRDEEEYAKAVDLLVAPTLRAMPKDEAAARLKLYRSVHLAPLPGEAGGCVAWPVPEGETADRAFLAHFAFHEAWRQVTSPGVRAPDWLTEGAAYAVLNDLFPDDPTCCVNTGYGRSPPGSTYWRNTRTWAGTARTLAVQGSALGFEDLSGLDLNSLSCEGLVQSWSVLRVLEAKDASGTRAFIRRVRRGVSQREALKDCLRLDAAGVDRLWRTEVLRTR